MDSALLRACLPTSKDNRVVSRVKGGMYRLHREFHRATLRPTLPVSILIANWNTRELIEDTVERVCRHTSGDYELLVVDNGSTDGSAEYLRSDPRVRAITLSRNIGHGKALDFAALIARGEILIALDSDAHPVADHWIAKLTEMLKNHACAGVHHHREYVHPCCLAIRASTFHGHRLSFQSRWTKDYAQLGRTAWDVGEAISMRLLEMGEKLAYVPLDPGTAEVHQRNELGTVTRGGIYGGIVYHAWYGSRIKQDPAAVERDLVATKKEAIAA